MRLQLPLRRFVVADTSMRPGVEPRDRVLVWQWGRVRAGDLVVFREPDRQLTFGVKRVSGINADGSVVVRGDNPNVSRDSRDYGPVPRRLVIGRAIYRYLPAVRRGRL
jgi:nickel-type superoxide dismutase maturation protease